MNRTGDDCDIHFIGNYGKSFHPIAEPLNVQIYATFPELSKATAVTVNTNIGSLHVSMSDGKIYTLYNTPTIVEWGGQNAHYLAVS